MKSYLQSSLKVVTVCLLINPLLAMQTTKKRTIEEVRSAIDDLFEAADQGCLSGIQAALDAGVAVNAVDDHDNTPLHQAAECGHDQACALLLNRGAAVDAKNNHNETPLFLASLGLHPETCKVLLDHGAQVNTRAWDEDLSEQEKAHYAHPSSSPLHSALGDNGNYRKEHRMATVKLLLERNADIHAIGNGDDSALTPLQLASAYNNFEAAVLLLDQNAAINAPSTRYGGGPALHEAAKYEGTPEMCTLLLDRNADINQLDDGKTPLHIAVACGKKENVALLLDRNADVNAKGNAGWTCVGNSTPLHTLKERRGKTDSLLTVWNMLVAAGADTTALDAHGHTPLQGICLPRDSWDAAEDKTGVEFFKALCEQELSANPEVTVRLLFHDGEVTCRKSYLKVSPVLNTYSDKYEVLDLAETSISCKTWKLLMKNIRLVYQITRLHEVLQDRPNPEPLLPIFQARHDLSSKLHDFLDTYSQEQLVMLGKDFHGLQIPVFEEACLNHIGQGVARYIKDIMQQHGGSLSCLTHIRAGMQEVLHQNLQKRDTDDEGDEDEKE